MSQIINHKSKSSGVLSYSDRCQKGDSKLKDYSALGPGPVLYKNKSYWEGQTKQLFIFILMVSLLLFSTFMNYQYYKYKDKVIQYEREEERRVLEEIYKAR